MCAHTYINILYTDIIYTYLKHSDGRGGEDYKHMWFGMHTQYISNAIFVTANTVTGIQGHDSNICLLSVNSIRIQTNSCDVNKSTTILYTRVVARMQNKFLRKKYKLRCEITKPLARVSYVCVLLKTVKTCFEGVFLHVNHWELWFIYINHKSLPSHTF